MKKNIKYSAIVIFIFAVGFILLSSSMHDFYTSITKVEYNAGTKSLKFASKLNADHLQKALGKNTDSPDFNTAVKNYVLKNITVAVNDAPVKVSFSAQNRDGDVVWVYFEVNGIDKIDNIAVKNTLLIEQFPSQQNFVNLLINGQKKSFVCKKGNETGKVSF